LATINAPIVVPSGGRDTYAITPNAAGIAHGRDDLRATAIDSVRFVDAQSDAQFDATQASATASERWQRPDIDATDWTQVVSRRPQQTLPFLTQLLAQQDTAEDAGAQTGQPLPSTRFAARQAYLASRDSTVEYLSPTPLYDLFV
jgi:hypothetical protein